MQTLRDDLVLAARAVLRRRGTSLLVVLSVAVAIAANTAFFGVLRGFMLRPLPYPEHDRLVILWQLDRGAGDDPEMAVTAADFAAWRREARSFVLLAALADGVHAVTSTEPAEEVPGARVTADFLPLFGGRAALGRTLDTTDMAPGAPPVVVLAHDYWERRFAADPGVLGRRVRIDEREHTVVGVLGRDFSYVQPGRGLWLPLPLADAPAASDEHELLVFGRLAPGATVAAAHAELGAIAARREAALPATNRGVGALARHLRDELPGPTDRKLFTLVQGAIALLLLIACANVANVLVARGQDRQRELAVRAALGAGRGRILRLLLTESALLAGAASALGLGLAAVLVLLLRKALAGELGPALLPTIDGGVVGFAALLTGAAVLLFGLGPALAAVRPDLASGLRQRGGTGPRRRLQRALVVLEVTLALVMLSATGLLVSSLGAMRVLDSGFAERGLLTFRLQLPERYDEERLAGSFEELRGRLASAAGVSGVTLASSPPRSRSQPQLPFTVEGEATPPDARPHSAIVLAVGDAYFETLGIPRRSGRSLAPADRADAPPVAVVSAEFARRFLRGEPFGQRVVVGGRPREVVGVAGDVIQTRTLEEGGLRNPIVYLPLRQEPVRQVAFLVRSPLAPAALTEVVRAETRRFDPLLVAADVQTMRQLIDAQFGGARVLSRMLAGFSAVALGLAALGVYGVVAYAVARRRREIGIRMAVGARPRDVVRHFALQGAGLAGAGLVLATPAVVLVQRAVAAILQGNFPVPWLALPAIAAVLAATALLASWLPARRAARLDPTTVLASD